MAESVSEVAESKDELVQRIKDTYELLQMLREPTAGEIDGLGPMGVEFFPIEPESYATVVSKYPAHFFDGQLDYAKRKPELRDYVPPAMTVGVYVKRPAIDGSFNRSQLWQLRRIEEHAKQTVEARFPGATEVMLPTTVIAQIDIQTKGKFLSNYSARCLERTDRFRVVHAGRSRSDGRFWVSECDFYDGRPSIGAVPGVVFRRN